MPNHKNIDVVILCGGLGTRLKGVVNDRPKPMAEINGLPFLDILIDYVANCGFTRFILCVGYKGDFIKKYYEDKENGLTFFVSQEDKPLGTAGAIKNAEPFIKSDIFLVLNGDSFCPININDFLTFHINKKALLSIALTHTEHSSDYGIIRINDNQKILSFTEKTRVNNISLINAGVYFFDKTILKEIKTGQKVSLEYDLFPAILNKDIYGYVTNEKLIDIGTPERLEMAKEYFLKGKNSS